MEKNKKKKKKCSLRYIMKFVAALAGWRAAP